jgi:hypothetical protein
MWNLHHTATCGLAGLDRVVASCVEFLYSLA